MAVPARKIQVGFPVNERTALEEKVDHIQSDVAGLRTDVKRIEAKLDSKTDALDAKLDSKTAALDAKFDSKTDALMAELTKHRIETERSFAKLREDMTKGFGDLRVEIKDAIEKFRIGRNAQIAWFIGTVLTATGMALAAARLFATPHP
jgi:Skp family chaperone for outer membrane proteins